MVTHPLSVQIETSVGANTVAVDEGNIRVASSHHQRVLAVSQPMMKTVQTTSVQYRSRRAQGRHHNSRAPVPVKESELRTCGNSRHISGGKFSVSIKARWGE